MRVLYAAMFCWLALIHAIAYLGVALMIYMKTDSSGMSFWLFPLPWTGLVLFLLLIPVYLAVYVSTVLVSPSKKILKLIREGYGESYEKLAAVFDDGSMIKERLNDLLSTGCVVLENGSYRLSSNGWGMARILRVYQVIIGRGVGG